MKSVLVTGANGFIGRNLIKYLTKKGIRVWAVDRSHENSPFQDTDGVRLLTASLEEIGVLEQYSDCHPEVFYHFAWAGTTGEMRAAYGIQLDNAKYVCEAAKVSKQLGCRRFIAPGTITEKVVPYAVEHHCVSPGLVYAIAKVAASNLLEVVAKKEAIDYIWVRLSNIFGGDNTNGNLISYTLSEFEKGNIPSYGPCLQPYNFTYIDDVVEALYLLGEAEEHPSNTYFLSNGEKRLLKEYLEEVSEIFGKAVNIGGRTDDGVRYQEEWFEDKEIQQDFGFSPKYTFTDAIKIIREGG